MSHLFDISKRVPMVQYQTDKFRFLYPEGGQIVVFDQQPERISWRLIAKLSGVEFQYDIHDMPNDETAENYANFQFEKASPVFHSENIAPHRLSCGTEIWRCKARFVDGFSAIFIVDAAFAQSLSKAIYMLQFATIPKDYELGKIVFETILSTFEFVATPNL